MSTPIFSRETMRARGATAFAAGAGRNDHNFNWHSTAAIADWQQGWDDAAALAREERMREAETV